MISFSKSGPVNDLISGIAGLNSEKGIEEEAKILAVAMLKKVEQTSAHINLTVNFLPRINAQQVEIQISGKKD